MMTEAQSAHPSAERRPSVFRYTEYRSFIREAYEHKRRVHPAFSESALIQKAGLSASSRGYLKRIVDGRRNLAANTVRGFAEALGLNPKETIYFENLVNYNQATKPKDRDYFYHRLIASAEGHETEQVEVLKAQYALYSSWHLLAVLQLVGLHHFNPDPAWISAELRSKISRAQAAQAMAQLTLLGLIRHDEQGKLVQSDALVKYPGNIPNHAIQQLHRQMLDRAKEALADDPYTERRASCLTLSCDGSRFADLVRDVDDFRDQMNRKYGVGSLKPDTVFQVGFQIFQLTPIRNKALKGASS